MKIKFQIAIFVLISVIISSVNTYGQRKDENGYYILKELSEQDAQRVFGDLYAPKVFKANGESRLIKESIISGNKITTIVYNYASICKPNTLGNIADLVWNGLGYGFEFGPLAAAAVMNDSNNVEHIVDDSFINTGQGDYSPDNTLKWGWLPKTGYVDSTQDEIARLNVGDVNGDGKPDSWPERWYSSGAGKYVWPAFLGDQATAPDEEVYFVVDDYTNAEFPYTPFPSDLAKKGLGLDMEVRIIQFNNPLAENIMFLVYQITNSSEKDLGEAYFGMHGDPHVGGASDYSDDFAGFVDPFGNSLQTSQAFPQRARNMVYAWDDPPKGMGGKTTGYFGWKFLESPSNAVDGMDNDDDGITDETPENSAGDYIDDANAKTGISDLAKYTEVYGEPKARYSGDEDGDWDPGKDDIGVDGISPDSPNYPGPDFGEGDGTPSQQWYLDSDNNGQYDVGEPVSIERILGYTWNGSEPNFGLRDISESDQIGLTSFHAANYTNSLPNVPKNDPLMWEWLSAGVIDTAGQELLRDKGDNIFNFGTGPLNLEQGETQRFSMCILFGNDLNDLVLNAETSTRILEADYRFAQPPAKPVVQAIPGDGKVTLVWDTGAEESVDPLSGEKDFQGYKIYRSRDYTFSDVFSITDGNGNKFLGKPIAQFDLDDSLSGYHDVEYAGRGVKYWMGSNTGLVHEYVDSTVTNGIRYFYAVVAFDSGTDKIPPTETQSVISRDPVTGVLTFDVNTAEVVPGSYSAGLIDAEAGNGGSPTQITGNSTGSLSIKVMDDLKVENDKLYSIAFKDSVTYSILDSTGVRESFTSKDTVFVTLSHQNIAAGSVKLYDSGKNLVPSSQYDINLVPGRIKGTSNGSLPANEVFTIEYRYYPVFESQYVNSEDGNPTFDGMRLYVQMDTLGLDLENTGWVNEVSTNLIDSLQWDPKGNYPGNKVKYRADWEVRWLALDTLAGGAWANVGDTALNQLLQNVFCPFNIVDATTNQPAKYLIKEQGTTDGNGQWDFGEGIILRPTDVGPTPPDLRVSYYLEFKFAPDSVAAPVWPKAGDVFKVVTTKPFKAGDEYEFATKGAGFSSSDAKNKLDNVYVVPNPYVAYSIAEEPGRTSDKRGDRVLEFKNLPQECTIRIYTITGDLVQTIYKDDYSDMATWDLLSFEGQRIAYGVYIYHVDAPGVGEKIGRFAVIK